MERTQSTGSTGSVDSNNSTSCIQNSINYQSDEYYTVWESVLKMSEEDCKRHPVAMKHQCAALRQHFGETKSWAAVMTITDQPNQVIGKFDSSLEAIRRATCAALMMNSTTTKPKDASNNSSISPNKNLSGPSKLNKPPTVPTSTKSIIVRDNISFKNPKLKSALLAFTKPPPNSKTKNVQTDSSTNKKIILNTNTNNPVNNTVTKPSSIPVTSKVRSTKLVRTVTKMVPSNMIPPIGTTSPASKAPPSKKLKSCKIMEDGSTANSRKNVGPDEQLHSSGKEDTNKHFPIKLKICEDDDPFAFAPNAYPCEISDPKTGEVLDVFHSCNQVQHETGVRRNALGNLCKEDGGTVDGKYFRFIPQKECIKMLERNKRRGDKNPSRYKNFSILKSSQFKQYVSQIAKQHLEDESENESEKGEEQNILYPSSWKSSRKKLRQEGPSSPSYVPTQKSDETSDDEFDSTSLIPLHPQKVTRRVKKYVELVENKTQKVLVCFRGNLDAGRALGYDRKKVGRACQSYGAPFEIKFKGYHLRYKKVGEPLVAYEYGKHKEDFMKINETHEERMARWKRAFEEDRKNYPHYHRSGPSINSPNSQDWDDSSTAESKKMQYEPTTVSTSVNKRSSSIQSEDIGYISNHKNAQDQPKNVVPQNKKIYELNDSSRNCTSPQPEIQKQTSLKGVAPPLRTKQHRGMEMKSDEVDDSYRNASTFNSIYPSAPALFRKRHSQQQNNQPCIICQSVPAQVTFEPCLHSIVCVQCSSEYWSKYCPVCRIRIDERMESTQATYIRPRVFSAYSFV